MSDHEFKEPINIPGTPEYVEHHRKLDKAAQDSLDLLAELDRKAKEGKK